MDKYSLRYKNNDSYFKWLKFEIKSIEALTDKILEQIQKDKEKHPVPCHIQNHRFGITSSLSPEAGISEELYGGIYRFLVTLTHYLITKCSLHLQFSLPAVVSVPQFSSLPSVCCLLWKRLEAVCQTINYPKKTVNIQLSPNSESGRMSSSKSTQTENSCLAYCESCHTSTTLIKQLVYTIIDEQRKCGIKETHVSKFRKQLGEDVFGASQWAVMRGWVEAIRKDIIWAATMTTGAHKLCEEMHITQEMQEREQKKTVQSLTDQLAVTQSQLEAEEAQSKYLKHQVEEINTSLERRIKHSKGLEKTIGDIKQRLELLKESMKYLKNECSQLQNTYRSFRTFVKSTFLHESKNILHMKTYIMQTMKQMENYLNEKVQNEQRHQRDILVITALLDEKKSTIEEFKTVKSALIKENEKLKDYLLTLKESITERNQQIENVEELKLKIGCLEKTLEESKLREELYRTNIESSDQPILHFSGDPLTDMENQRKANKQKIRALLRENENLKTTMAKLKEFEPSRTNSPSSILTTE